MKGGGHGQANIEFLEANGLEYNIVKVYDNGVRIGVIRTNGRISTIFPDLCVATIKYKEAYND